MTVRPDAAQPQQKPVSVLKQALAFAVSDGVPTCSLQVAAVVGTLLNIINQGDALMSGAIVNWWKVALTYCVPYCVCTYGSVTARLRAHPQPATDQ